MKWVWIIGGGAVAALAAAAWVVISGLAEDPPKPVPFSELLADVKSRGGLQIRIHDRAYTYRLHGVDKQAKGPTADLAEARALRTAAH